MPGKILYEKLTSLVNYYKKRGGVPEWGSISMPILEKKNPELADFLKKKGLFVQISEDEGYDLSDKAIKIIMEQTGRAKKTLQLKKLEEAKAYVVIPVPLLSHELSILIKNKLIKPETPQKIETRNFTLKGKRLFREVVDQIRKRPMA